MTGYVIASTFHQIASQEKAVLVTGFEGSVKKLKYNTHFFKFYLDTFVYQVLWGK